MVIIEWILLLYIIFVPAEKPVFSFHKTLLGLIHTYLGKLRIRHLFEGCGADAQTYITYRRSISGCFDA